MAIRPRRSVALFAILAVLMVAGSYFFVMLLAVACVYLPYLMVSNSSSPGTQSVLLLFFGVVVAGAMLWSLVPRRDKFTSPGVVLDPSSEERLFSEIRDIATTLREPLPREVYLIGDVNAWVADRGGILGFGSKRVMGLGLPLLATLTVSQFRAVIAHEFGHYYSGDTSLGPWIYRTQMALIRTFQNIGSLGEFARILILRVMHLVVTMVLRAYFTVFLRAINLVSRRQEYRADELACLIAGSEPLIDGLRAIRAAAMAWEPYWRNEVVPVLDNGAIPPIAGGFAHFVAVPEVRHQIERALAKHIEQEKTNPYDTHPSLRDRITAAQKLSTPLQEQDVRPALTLLSDPEVIELRFLEARNPDAQPGSLRKVKWNDVGTSVTIPAWRKVAEEYAAIFPATTAELIPDMLQKLPGIGSRIRDAKGMLLTPEQRTQRAGHLLGIGLALALLDDGWELLLEPGSFQLSRGASRFNPFLPISQLMSKQLSSDAWRSQCRELGISKLIIFRQAAAAGC